MPYLCLVGPQAPRARSGHCRSSANERRSRPARQSPIHRSPSLLPVLGRLDAPEHGRGLLVVNRLSVGWGHVGDDDRKTVCAEVRLV